MSRTSHLLIVHTKRTRVPNSAHPWLSTADFHEARNHILRVCSRYGTAGEMGIRPIRRDVDMDDPQFNDIGEWPLATEYPKFFVSTTMWNDERFINVEVHNAEVLTKEWIESVCACLKAKFPKWGVSITNLTDGGVCLYASRILVTGRPFRHCEDVGSVIAVMRNLLLITKPE